MRSTFVALSLWLTISFAFAQHKKKAAEGETAARKSDVEAKVSGMKKYPGYFEYYYDERQDKIYLLIDRFEEEFLYVNSLAAGVGSNDIGLDRGQLGAERIVKFERRGPKILLVEPNYRYRAVTDNPDEKRAVEEAFAQSVLWGFRVESEANGQVLVDATDFFLQDAHDVIGSLRKAKQGNYSLEKSRSAFYMPRVKNFPKNSEFEVTLTFLGQPSGGFIRSVTPTPNSVSVRQHHSFVQLPDSDYHPRKFDPRAGYFGITFFDYATPLNESIEKKFIARHRLKKKDPTAALSEPVEPIIYYLDRGTPEPIRSALLEGARWWDQAFQAAGYKNAFQVELMPEDADPMDVRYNVIQWVHRATRGWSYGASVMDPRTGEIIKGHVTLGSLRVRQDYLIAEGLLAPYVDGKPAPKAMEEMALARLRQLAAHEIGHTLGLAHSYASSSESDASVMDYPHPNVILANGKVDLGKAYGNKIGVWDKFAIRYGYDDFPSGTNEKDTLQAIIQESLKAGLSFLSDQDARPKGGAHPYAHLWDNGRDAADELNRILEIRAVVLRNFGENNIKVGDPMATLEEVLVPMYFFHRYQVEASAKLIGGLNYRYALRGDGQLVTEMVSPAEQQKALDAILKTITPSVLMLPESLLKILPPRPLGSRHHRELLESRTDLAFDALGAAESAAEMSISLVLQPARCARLAEYHSRDARQPGLESVIDQLVLATFKHSPKSGYEGAIQVTVNAVLLHNLIKLALDKDASSQVRAIAYLKLKQLDVWLNDKIKNTGAEDWKAHYVFSQYQIQQFDKNPEEYSASPALATPPGQPIGSGDLEFCREF